MIPFRATLALVFVACLPLLGCASSLTLDLRGGKNLNPNESNEPTTVYVRIYQLRGDRAWKDANYLKLWKNDRDVLGTDVIGSYQEVLLDADKIKEVEVQVSDGAKFLGVMGLFNRAEKRSWQQCLPVDEADDLPLVFDRFQISRKES